MSEVLLFAAQAAFHSLGGAAVVGLWGALAYAFARWFAGDEWPF